LIHLSDQGLKRPPDETIWKWAETNGYTIVTTDSDFVALSVDLGWPPKVIHVEEYDFSLRVIEELLRQNAVRISELGKDLHTGLLAVRLNKERGRR
jgi:predicted nuclease of predicted toxin-antitoxin system